jgi:2-aminobenzoate-CoA ligase
MAKSAHLDTFAKDNLPDPSLWPELILNHPTATYPERLNASYELLERTIELVGAEKVAIIAAEGTYSYGQLLELVNRISNLLTSEGVIPGNRIAIRGPNNAMAVAIGWLFSALAQSR